MRNLHLTREDVTDLDAGKTINVMVEGGEELIASADPADYSRRIAALERVQEHIKTRAVEHGAEPHTEVKIEAWPDDRDGFRVAEIDLWTPRKDDPRLGGGASWMSADPDCGAACFYAERAVLTIMEPGDHDPEQEVEDALWRLDEAMWGNDVPDEETPAEAAQQAPEESEELAALRTLLYHLNQPGNTLTDAAEVAHKRVREAHIIDSLAEKEEQPKEPTWTFVGHWENCRIVVEYVVPGDVQDPREDTGFWEEGLFAASASGRTQEEALAAVRDEYETCED